MIVLILVTLIVFGLIFGSFANALVWRLHGQENIRDKLSKQQSKPNAKKIASLEAELRLLSMSKGRSMCSQCRHPLASKDLVPFFSWLWLRGKCRYCRQPIEDPPLMEVGMAAAFVVSYLYWPLDLSGYGLLAFVLWLIFLVGFAALTLYDLRWFLLPDKIVWPLVSLAAAQVIVHAFVFGGGGRAVATAVWGVAMASGIFYVLNKVSNGRWIGFGDVKLGIVLGLLVGGPAQGLMLIFIASLLGTLASLPLMLRHKATRTSVIPFGPFLMAAAWILVLAGERLLNWFNNFVLLV